VSNYLNLNTFPDLKRVHSKEIALFYGGGINYHRGLKFVIDGMAIVKKKYPNIILIIIGEGNYVGTLKQKVKELSLEDSVKFLGWMSQNDLFAQMMKATIALIPHIRSEHSNNTIPNKIFQYMYAQIPTLSTNCDPLKRIIEKEGVGLIYEHNSPKDFAKKLQVLIKDNTDNKYGVNGK
jgi:glycosyltransferase involved in cell wall biosynthesis